MLVLEKGYQDQDACWSSGGVSNAFSALIPGAVIVVGATIVHGFVHGISYDCDGDYLQYDSDSIARNDRLYWRAVLMSFLTPFLWFFGVHGSTIVGGIMTGILQANSLENQGIA